MIRGIVSYILLVAVLSAFAARATAEPATAVLDAEARRIAVMEKAKDCVLAVFSPDGRGGGSGVVVSPDGYALTNYHVVMPCGKSMLCGMADGKVYDAVLVGIDPTGDVALIKLFGRDDFPCAELADSDQVRVGDWVFAMGNPFLLATNLQPTATYGIVSGIHRYQGRSLEYTDCIQTDASINPGNSGGPLFDAQGRLIGINGRASFEKRGRVNVGAAYAISINQIKNFLGALHGGRVVDHATLGATVNWDDEGRVVVTDILDSSDAYRRGLRYDDEIVRFGGRAISTPNGLLNVLGIFPKGWRVPLSYRHDGQRYDVLVRLAGFHRQAELQQQRGTPPPPAKPGPKPKRGKKPSLKKLPAKAPVPEIVKKHFQKKRGFANYYYNILQQKRVWNAWNARAKLAGTDGVWTLSGPLANGGQYTFRIADAGVSLKLPSTEINWLPSDELASSLLPAHSGGLLPALYLWRRLATEGLSRFGNVYYDGTAPLPGHQGLVDVLVGSHKGVDCRFYFDPAEGRLLAIEMFPDEESDPCEIYFSDDREFSGHWLPGRMEVRHGNEVFAVFKLEGFTVEP